MDAILAAATASDYHGGPKKRGRKTGTKMGATPRWSAEEEAQLHDIILNAPASVAKTALFERAADLLGTGRTAASVEQHFYYLKRKGGGKSGSKENATVNKAKAKAGRPPAKKAKRSAAATVNKQLSPINANLPPPSIVMGKAPIYEDPEPEEYDDSVYSDDGEDQSSDEENYKEVKPLVQVDSEEGKEEMERLKLCDREGRCFGCLDLLGESGVPFWIQHPQDEGEVITDVLFCEECYDERSADERRQSGVGW